jgi:hypothetical protein
MCSGWFGTMPRSATTVPVAVASRSERSETFSGAVSPLRPPPIQSRAVSCRTPSGTITVSQWRHSVRSTSSGVRQLCDTRSTT